MSVRIKRWSQNGTEQKEDVEIDYSAKEVQDSEGYRYVFGVNEVKNFADDGRGLAISGAAIDTIVQDTITDSAGAA